jgi:hypothetical protein
LLIEGEPVACSNQKERQAEVEDLAWHGYTQKQIAAKVGCHPSQVSRDLRSAHKSHGEELDKDRNACLAEILAENEKVKQAHWRSHERALEPREITTTGFTNNRVSGRSDHARIRREPGRDNPAALAGVERCLERKARLLGVEEGTRSGAETPPTPQYSSDKQEDQFERFVELIRDALVEASGPRIRPGDHLPAGFSVPEDDDDEPRDEDWMTRTIRRVAARGVPAYEPLSPEHDKAR